MSQPETPRSCCFDTKDPRLVDLGNAVIDWIYSENDGPRNRAEANLCNWTNFLLEGDAYKAFDLSKFKDTDVMGPGRFPRSKP